MRTSDTSRRPARMLGALIAAVAVAVGLVVGAGSAAASPRVAAHAGGVIHHVAAAPHAVKKPAATKTKVKRVTPFFKDGRLRSAQDWNADSVTLDSLMCGRSIVAEKVRGVYSCGGGASYLPACWINPVDSYPELLCLRTASDKKFIAGYVNGTPPKAPKRAAYDPWQIVLTSGVVCNLSGGMPWAQPPDDLDATYWCADGSVLLAKSGKRTYAKKTGIVLMQKTVSPTAKVYRVHAKKVVYAGAAPKVAPAKTGKACPSAAVLSKALPKGSTVRPSASDGIHCAKGWAHAAYSDGQNMYAGIFKKTKRGWAERDRGKVCALPGPVPAAIYYGCTVS